MEQIPCKTYIRLNITSPCPPLAISHVGYGVQGVWTRGHRGQCGAGGKGTGGMGHMGNGGIGGNAVQAHLDLLRIGQNIFAMTRKEGHT